MAASRDSIIKKEVATIKLDTEAINAGGTSTFSDVQIWDSHVENDWENYKDYLREKTLPLSEGEDLMAAFVTFYEKLLEKPSKELVEPSKELEKVSKELVEPSKQLKEVSEVSEELKKKKRELKKKKRELNKKKRELNKKKREPLEQEEKLLEKKIEPLEKEKKRLGNIIKPLEEEKKRLEDIVKPLEEEIERLEGEIDLCKNYQSEFLLYLQKRNGWPRIIVPVKDWLKKMPAGDEKERTQDIRLGELIDIVSEGLPKKCETLSTTAIKGWDEVFECINKSNHTDALAAFEKISEQDPPNPIYNALIQTHNISYLKEEIISKSSKHKSFFSIEKDLKLNKNTFESNVRQLHALHQGIKTNEILQFLVADPTHHAGFELGSGFCAINKQMAYIKMMQEKNKNVGFDTHVIQIGLDVNQDNGNKDIWENWEEKSAEEPKSLSHYHIDVYDKRVYPCPETEDEYFDVDTSKEEKSIPSDKGTKIDLSACEKESTEIMEHLIRQIRGQIKQVKDHNTQEGVTKKKVVLSLPIGFDSSVDEKAPCGTCTYEVVVDEETGEDVVDEETGKKIYKEVETPKDSLKRFSREDYDYFFEQLNSIIDLNKDEISGALITLEGGYTLGKSGLEGYVARMLSKLDESFVAASTTPIAEGFKASGTKRVGTAMESKRDKVQKTRFSERLKEMASATGPSSSG